MSKRFEGKVVLVSGAASGIGLATAAAFAREGGKVVVADLNADGAAKTAAEIQSSGGSATSVRVDTSDLASCVAMVDHAVKTFGGLNIAFNNAGISSAIYDSLEDCSIEDWKRTLGVNLDGVFYAIKAEMPALRAAGGGAIINTVSTAAMQGVPGLAAYVSSKHGVAGLTRAAAMDLIRYNIRVNGVCPGFTQTAMTAPYWQNDESRKVAEAMAPIGRFSQPSEIAEPVLFLASDAASYMVSELMVVDGGMLLP